MSHHRYKSEFTAWKSPYFDPRYSPSVTDQQIADNASKALMIDRRGRVHSPSKSGRSNTEENRKHNSNLSLRDTRLKREIIRELHAQIPGSLNICIPIRTTSAPYRQQSKTDKNHNEELNKLKNGFEEMKVKMKQQDELIEDLRQQLEKKDKTPPPSPSPSLSPLISPSISRSPAVIETATPTMPYVEDPPAIELVQTVWE